MSHIGWVRRSSRLQILSAGRRHVARRLTYSSLEETTNDSDNSVEQHSLSGVQERKEGDISIENSQELKTNNPLNSPRSVTIPLDDLAPATVTSSPPTSKKRKRTKKSPLTQGKLAIYSADLEKIAPENPWIDLQVTPEELRASATLTTGQCFSWISVVPNDNQLNADETKSESGIKDDPVKMKQDIIPHQDFHTETSTGDDAKLKQEAAQQHQKNQQHTANKSPKPSAWGTHNATEWVGPFPPHYILSIRETPRTTLYRVLHGPTSSELHHSIRQYFQLDTPLAPLYKQWSTNAVDEKDKSKERLKRIAKVIPGVRVLQQEPWECLISFLCSSNNNIPRITKMLASLREQYGDEMMELPQRWAKPEEEAQDGEEEAEMEAPPGLTLYSFPTVEQASHATEMELRDLGFGYRAKYLVQTCRHVREKGGQGYLYSLRDVDRSNLISNDEDNKSEKLTKKDPNANEDNARQENAKFVQEELMQCTGVGRKVADCVALFSLDQTSVVPVDVHVLRMACRDFHHQDASLEKVKSMTPVVYDKVGGMFRERFGEYAGWAHSLLFVAELPSFREVLPRDMVQEMDLWKEKEKARKRSSKN